MPSTWSITCHYMQHCPITCSITCQLHDQLRAWLHAAPFHYMFHYMTITWSITWFITCSTTYHYMHWMAWNFLSPWSRVSCAAFHAQEVSLLQRQRCSRSSSAAVTIGEGLAREDPPQLPQTWKHRAGVSKNNETWAEQFKMGWRIQSTAKLKMGWRIQSPANYSRILTHMDTNTTLNKETKVPSSTNRTEDKKIESSHQHDIKQRNKSPVEHQQDKTWAEQYQPIAKWNMGGVIPAHCEMKHGRSNSSPLRNETWAEQFQPICKSASKNYTSRHECLPHLTP